MADGSGGVFGQRVGSGKAWLKRAVASSLLGGGLLVDHSLWLRLCLCLLAATFAICDDEAVRLRS